MQYVITLVHGTFAPHSAWTVDGSLLRNTFRTVLDGDVAFEPFAWSGNNSRTARATASEDLVAHLDRIHAEYPLALHAIVAHSHGGNIALRALRQAPSLQSWLRAWR